MDFHGRIMNLQRREGYAVDTYACGHRDARHQAAEVGLEADAEVERLRAALMKISIQTPAEIRETPDRTVRWATAALYEDDT